jgi:hypothetical protein
MTKKTAKKKTGLKRGQYHVRLTAPDGTTITITAANGAESAVIMETAVHWNGIEVIEEFNSRGVSVRTWDWKDQPGYKKGKR